MIYDSIVIGAGPAGLAVACEMKKNGLQYLVFDKGPIGNHIMQFPVFMQFFSSREFLEIDQFPLAIPDEKPTRQQYLTYLTHLVRFNNLPVSTYTEVTNVVKEGDLFHVEIKHLDGRKENFQSKTIVAACGAYEKPRRLHIPGEDLPIVSHHFTESHKYFGKKVIVVGGRNSAIETALILFHAGAHVTLLYRGNDFSESSIKYWLKPDIEARVAKNEIVSFFNSDLLRIDPGQATIQINKKQTIIVETDFILLMTGYEPPLEFLRHIGVPFPPTGPVPNHNPETLETTNSGMFVAGVLVAGNISGKIFIENSRFHGKPIVKRIKELLSS